MGNYDKGADHWMAYEGRSTPWSFTNAYPLSMPIEVSVANKNELIIKSTASDTFYCSTKFDPNKGLPKGCDSVVQHGWTENGIDPDCSGLAPGKPIWVVC